MHLRHRHGDAAGDGRDHQHGLKLAGRQTAAGSSQRSSAGGAGSPQPSIVGPPPQQQRQRQHGHEAEDADAHIGLAPADGVDGMLQERRPDGAGEIVAAGDDRDRDAALPPEPVARRRPPAGRRWRSCRACRSAAPAPARTASRSPARAATTKPMPSMMAPKTSGTQDAEAVGQPAHQHAADGEAHHGRGVGQRRAAAADAELGLDRRQHDDRRPQPDAADGADGERRRQPPPGIAAVRSVRVPAIPVVIPVRHSQGEINSKPVGSRPA